MSGSGLPLAAKADLSDYKVLLLDVGLTQSIMDLGLTEWFLDPVQHLISKGSITEAFIGQELLAYSDPIKQQNLYYWRRIKQGIAEVDYLMQMRSEILPIEVKGGLGTTLRSLHSFLKNHDSPYGIRFSTQNTSLFERVHSYPLYAVSRVASQVYPRWMMLYTRYFHSFLFGSAISRGAGFGSTTPRWSLCRVTSKLKVSVHKPGNTEFLLQL